MCKMLFTVRDSKWFSILFMESEDDALLYVYNNRGSAKHLYSVAPSTICDVNTLLQLGGTIIDVR